MKTNPLLIRNLSLLLTQHHTRRTHLAMSTTVQEPAKTKAAPSGKQKPPVPEKKPLKILMLHGYAQTGPLFRSKTGAMSKMMAKALPAFSAERIYPTGPHRLRPADIPGFQPREGASGAAGEEEEELDAFGWFLHDEEAGPLRGLEAGMRAIADAIEEAGGVDGVLGFSQGGAVGALVAAALEEGAEGAATAEHAPWVRRLREANGGRPLRFCVVYSGFVARPGAGLGWLYERGIRTPTCHFFGSGDTVVEEPRCRALADRCVGAEVVVHPGGHHVPVRKEWVAPLLGFLKTMLEKEEEEEEEEDKTAAAESS